MRLVLKLTGVALVLLSLSAAVDAATVRVSPNQVLDLVAGGPNQDRVRGVVSLLNGDFVIAAECDSEAFGHPPQVGEVSTVFRMRPDGTVVWSTSESVATLIQDIAYDPVGDFIVWAGSTSGSQNNLIGGMTGALVTSTVPALALGRMKASSGVRWDYYTESNTETASSIALSSVTMLSDGSFFVAGDTTASSAYASATGSYALFGYLTKDAALFGTGFLVNELAPAGSVGFHVDVHEKESTLGNEIVAVLYSRGVYGTSPSDPESQASVVTISQADGTPSQPTTVPGFIAAMTKISGVDNTYIAVRNANYADIGSLAQSGETNGYADLVRIVSTPTGVTTEVVAGNFAAIDATTPGRDPALPEGPAFWAQDIVAIDDAGFVVAGPSNSDILSNEAGGRGPACAILSFDDSFAVEDIVRVELGDNVQQRHSNWCGRRLAASSSTSSVVLVGAWENDLAAGDPEKGTNGGLDLQVRRYPITVERPLPWWFYLAVGGAIGLIAGVLGVSLYRRSRKSSAAVQRKTYRVFDVDSAAHEDEETEVGKDKDGKDGKDDDKRKQAKILLAKKKKEKERLAREKLEKEKLDKEKEKAKAKAKSAGGATGEDAKTTTTVRTILSAATSVYGADDEEYGRTVPKAPRAKQQLLPDGLTTADIVELAGGSNEVPNVSKDAYVAKAVPTGETKLIGGNLYPDDDPDFTARLEPSEPASPDDAVEGRRHRKRSEKRDKSRKKHRYESSPSKSRGESPSRRKDRGDDDSKGRKQMTLSDMLGPDPGLGASLGGVSAGSKKKDRSAAGSVALAESDRRAGSGGRRRSDGRRKHRESENDRTGRSSSAGRRGKSKKRGDKDNKEEDVGEYLQGGTL